MSCKPILIAKPRCSMALYPHSPRFAGRKREAQNKAIRTALGGRITKFHCRVAELGNPLTFRLTLGDVSDVTPAPGTRKCAEFCIGRKEAVIANGMKTRRRLVTLKLAKSS